MRHETRIYKPVWAALGTMLGFVPITAVIYWLGSLRLNDKDHLSLLTAMQFSVVLIIVLWCLVGALMLFNRLLD